jgi:hemerythrin
MNWNDNLAVGVNSIDNQHKELFFKINDLLVAMKSGNGNNEIFKMLNFLENYVTKHFNDEESIQRKNNYPGYNIQHEQHEAFKKELTDLRKSVETHGVSAVYVISIQKKISDWWYNHITKLDKELGNYLAANYPSR